MSQPDTGAPYVICVGAEPDAVAAVAQALNGQGVVIAAADALALIPLLEARQDQPPVLADPAPSVRRGRLLIDRRLREVTWDGELVRLSGLEFDLLSLLATDLERVWTFEEMAQSVWKTDYLGDADMVLSTVKRLRRRLSGAASGLRVVSVRGVGFRLVLQEDKVSARKRGAPTMA